MNRPWRGATVDLLTGLAMVALASADVALRESYHRVGSESAPLFALALVGALMMMLALLSIRRHGDSGASAVVIRGARLAFTLALLFAWFTAIGISPAHLWDASRATKATVFGIGLAGFFLIMLASGGTRDAWVAGRNALVAAFVLFELSPFALGLYLAPSIAWPPGFQPEAATAARGHDVTIVLLLDELNANQADRFIRLLRDRGLNTAAVAVPSVGKSTQNVVPSLFTRKIFSQARPCGPTTTCDGAHALNYSRITASRPDIDVIGFYQPYCDMQGLRTCFRAKIQLTIFDTDRLRCGLWRRLGWPMGVNETSCRRVFTQVWGDMTDRVVAAASAAPALTQGGLLFAHVPLPHPPGSVAERHMAEHYRDNLERALLLVGEMVGKAQSSGLLTKVLIFSDHPLRQAHWCTDYAPYRWFGCEPDPSLQDDRVPLIAAGATLPDLSRFTSNLDVFDLVSGIR